MMRFKLKYGWRNREKRFEAMRRQKKGTKEWIDRYVLGKDLIEFMPSSVEDDHPGSALDGESGTTNPEIIDAKSSEKTRILKLHHPTGHPYWQSDEYKIEMPSGMFFDLDAIPKYKLPKYAWFSIGKFSIDAYRIIVKPDGVYYQMCGASSGGGKSNYKEPFKIIDKSVYDEVKYVGKPLVMSKSLVDDLIENEIIGGERD